MMAQARITAATVRSKGDAHFALLLRRPSLSGLLRLFLRAHQLVLAPVSVCVLVLSKCAAATGCRTASQTSWSCVTIES